MFFTPPFYGDMKKMFQNGQTELTNPILRLCQVTRRRTHVRREAKFVRSKKAKTGKIE